jgi:hypothetical protein
MDRIARLPQACAWGHHLSPAKVDLEWIRIIDAQRTREQMKRLCMWNLRLSW